MFNFHSSYCGVQLYLSFQHIQHFLHIASFIVVVIFVVVVILYRQGRIFKPPQNFEIEMDKRALTPVGKAKEANRLLTHEIDATMAMPETEDMNEGINSPEKVEEI